MLLLPVIHVISMQHSMLLNVFVMMVIIMMSIPNYARSVSVIVAHVVIILPTINVLTATTNNLFKVMVHVSVEMVSSKILKILKSVFHVILSAPLAQVLQIALV